MKYFFVLFISVAATFSAFSQASVPSDSIPFEIRKQAYIYQLAKKYNDPGVARNALYNLFALNPGNATVLDSLALWYFDYQQYASAALVASDALTINPDDMFAAEVAAVSFENLGVKDRAVTFYEKLYLGNNDINILYQLAYLQLGLKRYGEAILNIEAIIENPKSDEFKLIFPVDNKTSQEVTLKVAAIRLKGMIEADRGNTSLAKELYNQALEIAPDFTILKQQLEELNK